MKVVPYTFVNLGVVGTALALRNRTASGVAFANSVAVLLSFYTGLSIDPTARERLQRRWKCTFGEFVARDFVIHVLPVFFATVLAWRRPPHVRAGLLSLGLQAAWLGYAAYPDKSFGDLTHVYVRMQPWQWQLVLGVATVAHLGAIPALRAVKSRVRRLKGPVRV